MNESLGERDESNENEDGNEEFDFDDLDNEWSELSKALEVPPEVEAEQARKLAEFRGVRDYVLDQLIEQGIPRVIDTDREVELDMYDTFSERYFESRYIELSKNGGEVDDAFDRRISLDCIYEYFNEREFEAMILNHITAFRQALLSDKTLAGAESYIGMLKKQMQADLLVHYKRSPEDPWLKFLDEMIPSEGLDQAKPQDRLFMVIAEATERNFQQERAAKRKVVDEAKVIAGIDEENDDLEELAGIVAGLVNMEVIAAQPTVTNAQRIARNEELWSQLRWLPLDNDTAKRIVEHFEAAYPVLDFLGRTDQS